MPGDLTVWCGDKAAGLCLASCQLCQNVKGKIPIMSNRVYMSKEQNMSWDSDSSQTQRLVLKTPANNMILLLKLPALRPGPGSRWIKRKWHNNIYMEKWIYLQFWQKPEREKFSVYLSLAHRVLQLIGKMNQSSRSMHTEHFWGLQLQALASVFLLASWLLGLAIFIPLMVFPARILIPSLPKIQTT